MKTFCKLTTQSPAASYVPLPRFLLQDEALRGISNDAKVLYALLLDSVCPQYISRSLLCRWFRRAVLPRQPKLEQAILSRKNSAAAKSAARVFSPAPAGQNTAPLAPRRFTASRKQSPPANGGRA